MSVHQYIGARYVPYYYENSLDPSSTEWEPNVNYEALTVVTLPNQHSYISKKAVPDTIGSPATNAKYWLDTGSDNAYIQALQDQIDIINNTDLPAIDGRLDRLESISEKGDIIAVFDSYGTTHGNPTGDNTTIPDIMQSLTDRTIRPIVASSCGFVENAGGGTFYDFLNTYLTTLTTADKEKITTVVVAAGYNDFGAAKSALRTNMQAFYNKCKAELPNVNQLCFGYIANGDDGQNVPTHSTKAQQMTCYYNFKEICSELNIEWLENVDCVLHDYNLLTSDGHHPTVDGKVALGHALIEAIEFGYMCTSRELIATITADSGRTITKNGNIVSRIINNETFVTVPQYMYVTIPEAFTQNYQEITIATLGNSHILHPFSRLVLPMAALYETASPAETLALAGNVFIDPDGSLKVGVYTPLGMRNKNIQNILLIGNGTLSINAVNG